MKRLFLQALLLLIAAVTAQAQEITVHGTVISATDDEPLIGATVKSDVKPTNGTVTDIDGQFKITVPEGSSITVSYVGFQPQTIKATHEHQTIVLSDNQELLDELVVVGYQTVRKADLTGAVSVMNMKEPLSENSGNIMNSLAGKMPGVNVVPDAAPGGTGSIRIRGMGSINSTNDPLYIVDGVPTDNINMINPNDIESMQVLKDAASASIYGSRAANGVVIITTKHGKGDRMSINLNYAVSAQTVAKRYKMMNAEQWGRVYWQACQNSNVPLDTYAYTWDKFGNPTLKPYLNGYENFPVSDVDWQDEVYHCGVTNNLTASISNNTDKSSVLFSLNYINQNGNIKETFYERFSARLNSRFDFNKYVSVGENLQVAHWKNRGMDVAGDRGIPFLALSAHPTVPVYGVDGAWSNNKPLVGSDNQNPVHMINAAKDNNLQSWRILGNAFLEVRPVAGLTLKSNIGIEHSQYFNQFDNRPLNPSEKASVDMAYGQGDTWTWTNTANYLKTFNEKHNLMLLLGTEAIGYTFRDLTGWRDDFAFTDTDYMQLGAGTGTQKNGGGKSQWSIFSLFFKADYNYADRYLVSFTIRRDENSRFAKNKRGGVFPAASVAWRPTQEEFFPKNTVLSDMKVRYSWGQNGNAIIPSLYPSYSIYGPNILNGAYDLSGNGSSVSPGITLRESGNNELTWEKTTQNNIGLDFAFFNGALNLSADYYIKKTTDMLTLPPVLATAGEKAEVWQNTGSMRNNGWEITLGYNSPWYGDFSWSGNINISQYKNKMLKLNNQQDMLGTGDVRIIPGEAMGVYYGYVCDGIFQNAGQVGDHAAQSGAAPGRLMYRDLNGDGVISDADRCIIGDPNPDLSLGLNLNFKYKNLALDMFFAGDFGFDIINSMKRQLLFMGYGNAWTNRSADMVNAWTPTNTNTDIPAAALTDDNNEARFSSYFVENGSYMKMKYLKLSYSLPHKWIKSFAQSLDVYAQVENVFTMTKYKGLDPEILPDGWGGRVDNGAYPRPRTFTFGLNVQF